MQRIEDVRGDPISGCFLLFAALLLLQSRRPRTLLVGVLCAGCAAVFSIKLVFALPFVIAGAVLAARGRRLPVPLGATALAVVPGVAYLLWRTAADGPAVVFSTIRDILTAAGVPEHPYENSLLALQSDPVLWILVSVGAAAALYRGVRGERGLLFWYAALVVPFLIVFFLRNPFLFPYNFVILVPLAAPLIAGLRLPQFDSTMVVVLGPLVAVLNGVRGTRRMLAQRNNEQRRLIEWVWRATSEDEGVFDWQGMHVYRRGAVHWFIYGAQRYVSGGWYSLADEWSRGRVTLMIPNDRFEWINRRDHEYLARHYIAIAPCLFTLGHIFRAGEIGGSGAQFDTAIEGDYILQPANVIALVDNTRIVGQVHLTRGSHTIQIASPPTEIALVYTTPRRRAAGPPPCPAGPLLFGF